MIVQLAVLLAAVCLLALVIGLRPRWDAERWSRIASAAFTVSFFGYSVGTLAAFVWLAFR